MKRRNWVWILLIIAAIAVFMGYQSLEALQTDNRAPEIKLTEGELKVSVEDPKGALLQGISATDNRDGNVTDSLVVENVTILDDDGTVNVRFAAFDAAGNVARGTRKAVYTDYVSPRFTLKQPLVYAQGTSFDVLGNVGATDVFDGDIQHRVRATVMGEESVSMAGNHVVQFQVTNSLGDTQTVSLPVEVTMADPASAQMSLKEYLIYLPVGAPFNAASFLESFSYQRTNVKLSGVTPAGFHLETKGAVQTQNPGVYSVSYELTYTEVNENNPNSSREFTAYSKLIVIVEG
jgi:hypothetical protein